MTISNLTSKLEIGKLNFRNLQNDKEQSERKLTHLKSKISEIDKICESKLIQHVAEIDNSAQRNKFWQQKYSKLQEESVNKDTFMKYKAKYDANMDKLEITRNQLDSFKEQTNKLKAKLVKFQEIQDENSELNAQNVNLNQKLESFNDIQSNLKLSIQNYHQLDEENSRLKDENIELKISVADNQMVTKNEAENLRDIVDALKQENEHFENENANLSQQLGDQKLKVQMLQFQNQKLDINLDQALAENSDLQNKIDEVQQDVETLKKQNEDIHLDYKFACEQIQDLQQKINSKDINLQQIRQNRSEIENSSSIQTKQLQEKEAQFKNQTSSLSDEIQDLKLNLEMNEKDYLLKVNELQIRNDIMEGQLKTNQEMNALGKMKHQNLVEEKYCDLAELKHEVRVLRDQKIDSSLIEKYECEIKMHRSRCDFLEGQLLSLQAQDNDLTILRYRLTETQNSLEHTTHQWQETKQTLQNFKSKIVSLDDQILHQADYYNNLRESSTRELANYRDEMNKQLTMSLQQQRRTFEKKMMEKCSCQHNGFQEDLGDYNVDLVESEESATNVSFNIEIEEEKYVESKTSNMMQSTTGFEKIGGTTNHAKFEQEHPKFDFVLAQKEVGSSFAYGQNLGQNKSKESGFKKFGANLNQ